MINKFTITNRLTGKTQEWVLQAFNKGFLSHSQGDFLLTSIEGLGPLPNKIGILNSADRNAHTYVSSVEEKREITIRYSINPSTPALTSATLRNVLGQVFTYGIAIDFAFELMGDDNVFLTRAYVKNIEYDIFSKDATYVVTLACIQNGFETKWRDGLKEDDYFNDDQWDRIMKTDDSQTIFKIENPYDNIMYVGWWNIHTGDDTYPGVNNVSYHVTNPNYPPLVFTYTNKGPKNTGINTHKYNDASVIVGDPTIGRGFYRSTSPLTNWNHLVDRDSQWPILYPGSNTLEVKFDEGGRIKINIVGFNYRRDYLS